MKNKAAAALAAVIGIAVLSMLAGPIRSQTPPDRPFAVEEALWVPLTERVGLELVESERTAGPTDVQEAHLWVYSEAGLWRRVQLVRSVQVMPLRP